MDFQFEAPPQLELGQPIGYYHEQFNKELHDSSFPGCERFMGRVTLGGAERVVDLDSSIFSERLIFFEDFLTLGCEGKNIEFIEWWDRRYWDDYSFLEEAYPNE